MRIDTTISVRIFAMTLVFAACAADAGEDDDGGDACVSGGKCDTPTGPAAQACEKRQAEVLDSSNRGYTPDFVRWACADVEGVNTVNKDERGQEYCEYYAIVQPPLQDAQSREGFDFGRPKSSEAGDVTPLSLCLEGESSNCRTTINDDQMAWLEDNSSAVVGACVFTSWHADIPGPLPACPAGNCGTEAQVYGFPFNEEFFRMKVSFNSNSAAADLVEKCFELDDRDLVTEPNWSNPDDPFQDPFFRGCMGVNGLFGTEWRRSDPSICAAVNRLRECGCAVPGVTTAKQLGAAIVPPPSAPNHMRGFKLATWDDTHGLPPGCRYANTGEDAQSLVLCDITAADVLQNRQDPKEFCRATYGSNVVVHVPIPREAISCTPPQDMIAQSCGTFPWNIGDENAMVEGDTAGESGESGGSESGESGGSDGGSESTTGADPTTGGGSGSCTQPQETPGCDDDCIEMCVCQTHGDNFCCDTKWDAQCAGEVASFDCAQACG